VFNSIKVYHFTKLFEYIRHLLYTNTYNMRHQLFTIFTSPARTAVLELLCRVNTPLHLRAIAELTSFTPRAIQQVLSKLAQEKIIHSEPRGNKIFFSLNSSHEVTQYLKNIIDSLGTFSPETEKRLSRAIEFALTFTDETFELKNRIKPKSSALKLFKNIISLLFQEKSVFKITNELAASVFRDQVRNINSINLSVSAPKTKFNALTRKISAALPSFTTRRDSKAIVYQSKESSVSFIVSNQEETTQTFPLIKTELFDNLLLLSCPEEIIINSAKSFLRDSTNLLALDDIQSIMRAKIELDYPLIISNMIANRTPLHPSVLEFAPKTIKSISKSIERKYGPFPQLYNF
jgi:DNA-binding transcriptional ArsR family regulator